MPRGIPGSGPRSKAKVAGRKVAKTTARRKGGVTAKKKTAAKKAA